MKISHRPFYLSPVKQAVGIAAKRTILTACAFFIAIWAFLGALFAPIPASAAEDVVSAFEQRNVLDDLESSVIGGKNFELKDYAFHAGIEPQVLLLTEFCYSYEPDRQSDYGLYLYVWNPQGLQFDVSSGRNAVEIACGDGRPEKYPLEFLNRSERADYEGLFYKFKVTLSAAQKGDVLADLNASERVYHVSGVELLGQGGVNPVEYEANAFAAHLLIDDEELVHYLKQGYDVAQLSAAMNTNINLMLIKLNEMNRMGRNYELPYVPHADFLKSIKPES